MAPAFETRLHGLADAPGVKDIRNIGMVGAIELESNGPLGSAGRAVYARLWDLGLGVRPIGDSLAFSPPLTMDQPTLDRMGDMLNAALRS